MSRRRPARALARLAFALPVAILTAASPVRAQSSWREHADLSRAREATDSFAVVMRGKTTGWQRLGWTPRTTNETTGPVVLRWTTPADAAPPAWTMSDEIALGGVHQRSEIRFSSGAIELGLRQGGMMGTTEMRIALDRAKGRITGSALTPSGGATPVPMDVAASDDVIDDNALTVILPLIRWREGITFTIPVLSSGKGEIEPYAASVTGRQVTTVPAGTFETWRVSLAGPKYALDADVTVSAPYRVVRFGPRGMPMESQLVK